MYGPALFQYLNPPSGLIFSHHGPDKSLELEVSQVLLQRLWAFARCCVSSVTFLSPGPGHSPAPGQVQLPCSQWSDCRGWNWMATQISRLLTLLSILALGLALMGVAAALCQTVFSSFIIIVRKVCKK